MTDFVEHIAYPLLLEKDLPTISVDRALGHVATNFDVDVLEIARFYEALPHEAKRPLSELHVHFSASTVTSDDGIYIEGSYLKYGTSDFWADETPELPRTTGSTIVVYLGSILANEYKKDCILFMDVNEAVTHELTHFAQDTTFDHTSKRDSNTKRIFEELATISTNVINGVAEDTKWVTTGIATLAAVELGSSTSFTAALQLSLGIAALTHARGIKPRSKIRRQKQAAISATEYDANVLEIEAFELEDRTVRITSIHNFETSKTDYEKSRIIRSDRPSVKQLLTNRKRRKQSLQPARLKRT